MDKDLRNVSILSQPHCLISNRLQKRYTQPFTQWFFEVFQAKPQLLSICSLCCFEAVPKQL